MIQLAGFMPELDIPIKITGLRPGEKLHESLVCATEQVIPTAHPKILAVSSQPPAPLSQQKAIATLLDATTASLPPDCLWKTAQHCITVLEDYPVCKQSAMEPRIGNR